MPRIVPEFITIAPHGDASHADARFAKVTRTNIDTLLVEMPGTKLITGFDRKTGRITPESQLPAAMFDRHAWRVVQNDLDAYAAALTFTVPLWRVNGEGKAELSPRDSASINDAVTHTAARFIDDVRATLDPAKATKELRIGFKVLDPPELREQGPSLAPSVAGSSGVLERSGQMRRVYASLCTHFGLAPLPETDRTDVAMADAIIAKISMTPKFTPPGHTPFHGAGGTPLIPDGKVYCEDVDLETVVPSQAFGPIDQKQKLRARLDASRIADCYLAPRAGLPLQRWGGALATICATIAAHSLMTQRGLSNPALTKSYEDARQMLRDYAAGEIDLVVEGSPRARPKFKFDGIHVDLGKMAESVGVHGDAVAVKALVDKLRHGNIPVDVVMFDVDPNNPAKFVRDFMSALGSKGGGSQASEQDPKDRVVLGGLSLPPRSTASCSAVKVTVSGGVEVRISCEFTSAGWDVMDDGWDEVHARLISHITAHPNTNYDIEHPETAKHGIDKVKLASVGRVEWNGHHGTFEIVGIKFKPEAPAPKPPVSQPPLAKTTEGFTSAGIVFAFEFYGARTDDKDPAVDIRNAEHIAKQAVEALSRHGALDAAAGVFLQAFDAECAVEYDAAE